MSFVGPFKNRMPPIHPGEFLLEDFLKPTNTSVDAFAVAAGLPVEHVQAIVVGTESVTADTASALSAALGTTAQFWLNLQATYDRRVAETAGGGGDS
jgi:antitoxin HigA-1